jgi:hypothetical protein
MFIKRHSSSFGTTKRTSSNGEEKGVDVKKGVREGEERGVDVKKGVRVGEERGVDVKKGYGASLVALQKRR